jgi:hypothetical protein
VSKPIVANLATPKDGVTMPYPACSQQDATQLEEAFSSRRTTLMDAFKSVSQQGCLCNLIKALVSGKATPEQQMVAGVLMAERKASDFMEETEALKMLEDKLQQILFAAPTKGLPS